jgi:hypothetical protein
MEKKIKNIKFASLSVSKEILEQFSKAVLYNVRQKGRVKETVESFMLSYVNKTINNFKKELEDERNDR